MKVLEFFDHAISFEVDLVTQVNVLCLYDYIYRIVASASLSRLEAHVGLFRLLIKGIFGPFVTF